VTGNEIRKAFLEFFAERNHKVIRSSSLIPGGDSTLLFTNAGMNQFKDIFLGRETRDYTRATSCQKCVRAGGKHNDLENVGRTARHQTFFEMLGNFSFGDYFKEEAIDYALEFLTKVAGLPEDRMVATVFAGEGDLERDKSAHDLWRRYLPRDRVLELGMHDNFWAMGEVGPCGPCSEVHYFQGDDIPCEEELAGRSCQGVECDCDRWVEVWNLVFMQYDRDANGNYTPLPAPCVDTGMGLERLTAIMQGKHSNYQTDLILPLIEATGAIVKMKYDPDDQSAVSMRVIADHIRAITFLIADGVVPSNEGRGYVLRKIIRRAARHGRMLGVEKPFLYRLVDNVCALMGEAYPEIIQQKRWVIEMVRREGEAFDATLSQGLRRLMEAAASLTLPDENAIPGEVLFNLYDTFGFPIDLAEDIARERNLKLDTEGFEHLMEKQREKARRSWKGGSESGEARKLAALEIHSDFLGYAELTVEETRLLVILKNGEAVKVASAGDDVEVAFKRTPFYAESGGQVGDVGTITTPNALLKVTETKKPVEGLILHQAKILSGEIREGDKARLSVDPETRAYTMANHTATHLLHAALRDILGEHVKQAGSFVGPSHLRFDFHHFAPLEQEILSSVEEWVNRVIMKGIRVETSVMPLEKAVGMGAMALFGEKYGEKVRVIRVPGYSMELCGGTHVSNTADIGIFKILEEHSVSSGIRRIEAVTNMPAYRYLSERDLVLKRISAVMKTPEDKLPEHIEKIQKELKHAEKEISRLRLQCASASSAGAKVAVPEIKGVKLLVQRVDGMSSSEVKNLADSLRDRLKSGVVVIGNSLGEKATVTVGVTPDLVSRLKASELARSLGKIIGGGGGGRPELAEAGGKFPEKLDEALEAAHSTLGEILADR